MPIPPDNNGPDDGAERAWPKGLWWWILVAILVAFGAVRWRLLDTPLERDEGEYAVFAQFILDGVPPYAEAVNMKLPGIYLVYAGVLATFGETARGIHMGLLVANLLSACLAALLARRLLRSQASGLVAAAAFLAFTIGPRLQGPWANAEAFLLPFLFLAGLALVRALEKERRVAALIGCGLVLGCAVLVKQHAALFCIAAGLILMGWHWKRPERSPKLLLRDVALLTCSTLIPYLATVAVLAACGVFDRFWFWTWDYARSYTGQYGIGDMLEVLAARAKGVLPAVWPLLVLAVIGSFGLLANKQKRGAGAGLIVLGLLSFAAISVGFIYRPHYFQLLGPFVALGCGAFVAAPRGAVTRRLLVACVGLGVLYVPFEERKVLFDLSPSELAATVYPGNGFEAMPEVGEYLAELVPEGERFAVLGSEPELYFYADRRPATSFVYTYSLMELHPYALKLQGEMAEEIEAHQPNILVVVHTPASWLRREESEMFIWTWIKRYLGDRFELVGVLVNSRQKRLLFREDSVKNVHPPKQAVLLEIYRRKSR